jgi:hypothetical protein
MVHMNDADNMFIAEDVAGFVKRLTEEGIFPRQLDFLLLGFSYAVQKRIFPVDRGKRHDLTEAAAVKRDIRQAVEVVAPWYARELGIDPPTDERSLLDFICRVGSAGIGALQKEWKDRSKSQIQSLILMLIKNTEDSRITSNREAIEDDAILKSL